MNIDDLNFYTTAIYPNRIRAKKKVEKELKLQEKGNENTIFYTLKNNIFAIGYNRIVYGDHGAYIEFEQSHIQCKLRSKFNSDLPANCYYEWLEPEDGSGVKVYDQKKDVKNLKNPPAGGFKGNREEGYADYKVGKIYVNPFELKLMNKKKLITELKSNEVFIFGSNKNGFHGAGSAGYAQRGDSKNNWRTDDIFLQALTELNKKNKNHPYNKEKLIGKWSVLGENGFMIGKEGKSYGIITTEAPGKQGIVDTNFLTLQISKFLIFANKNPQYYFKCVDIGLSRKYGGYSWWNPEELFTIWNTASQISALYFNELKTKIVDNIQFPSYLNVEAKPVDITMHFSYEKC